MTNHIFYNSFLHFDTKRKVILKLQYSFHSQQKNTQNIHTKTSLSMKLNIRNVGHDQVKCTSLSDYYKEETVQFS